MVITKQTRQAVHAINQPIFFRCLWIVFSLPFFDIYDCSTGSSVASSAGEAASFQPSTTATCNSPIMPKAETCPRTTDLLSEQVQSGKQRSPVDKLQLTGQNLGGVFNSRSNCMCAMRLCCFEAKWPSLKLKTRPKQLLGYLPLAFALPASPQPVMKKAYVIDPPSPSKRGCPVSYECGQ